MRYKVGMIKVEVSLPEETRARMEDLKRRTGLSLSALARRAVHMTYGGSPQTEQAVPRATVKPVNPAHPQKRPRRR